MPTVKLSCETDASGHWCRSHDQAYIICLKAYIAKLEAVAEAARALLSYGWRKGPVDAWILGEKQGELECALRDIGVTNTRTSSGE